MIKINFAPNNNLSKWSIGLIIITPILLYIGMSFVNFYEFVPAGKIILHDIIIRPGIALPMIVGFISGITAFFTGAISIIRKKDYSILVFLSTVIGFFILLWCLTQFLFS